MAPEDLESYEFVVCFVVLVVTVEGSAATTAGGLTTTGAG
jgi:hypothetical protein